ncbi:ead/Ea22-like family protein [Salmonella enterica]|nr:ead/Ea22-like family protein [Salmonella enterica]
MNIDKRTLREVAERAKDSFIPNFMAPTRDVLALLDENIQLQREKDAIEAVALALRDDMRQAREQLEEAEKQIVELSRAASVNSQWKPDVCPVTGRKFFMWIEHETLGYVPTYGGPFDSYTIPTRDSSGEFYRERYDHDLGGWVEGEFIGIYLIDDDEQCRVCELEERIAELEAREVTLPQRLQPGADGYDDWYVHSADDGEYLKADDVIEAIRAAGIKVKGE